MAFVAHLIQTNASGKLSKDPFKWLAHKLCGHFYIINVRRSTL